MSIIDGKYEVIRELGRGFSAVTKLARDSSGNMVALKVFDYSKGDMGEKQIELLKNEYEATAQFQHKHIVRYLDANWDTTEEKDGKSKSIGYIAMEPILGGELFDYVANSGAFDEKFARHFFKQMLMGLHYLATN